MKNILAIMIMTFLTLVSIAAYAEPDPNLHIYLMFGQSNMEGQGDIEQRDRQTNSRVKVLQSETCSGVGQYGEWRVASPPLIRCVGKIGPGDYFGKTMAEETAPEISIGLVGAAYQGQSIDFFLKDCARNGTCSPSGANGNVPAGHSGGYAWLVDLARKSQEAGVIKGIIFHQGESDTGQQSWLDRVNIVVTDLRNDLGVGDIPFIAGEMVPSACCVSHNTIVRQIPNYVINGHVVSADGLGRRDQYHFNTSGYREIGRRYALKMLSLVDASPVGDIPERCGMEDGSIVCCDISSDPDGDGWGWEYGDDCLVTSATDGYVGEDNTAGALGGPLVLFFFVLYAVCRKAKVMK